MGESLRLERAYPDATHPGQFVAQNPKETPIGEGLFVAPEFASGLPILDQDGRPALWFWRQIEQAEPPRDVVSFFGIVTSEDLSNTLGKKLKEIHFFSTSMPFGNFELDSDAIYFHGLAQSLFTGACNIIVSRGTVSGSSSNELRDVILEVKPGSSGVVIDGLRFTTQTPRRFWVDPNNRGHSIKMSGDQNAIRNCKITNNITEYRAGAYSVVNCFDCIFSGNTCVGGYWSFWVTSATRCKFISENSVSATVLGDIRPVVGFFNGPFAADLQLSRAHLVNNEYTDVSIDGWLEEGFSFDEGPNSIFFVSLATCESALDGAIVMQSTVDCAPGDLVSFLTGPASGDWYVIKSVSDKTLTIDWELSETPPSYSGQTLLIEKPCYGNTLKSVKCVSNGDEDGIVFWGHGGRTIVESCETIASGIRISSVGSDDTTLIPNSIRVNGFEASGLGSKFGVRTDIVFSGVDLQKKSNHTTYGISGLKVGDCRAMVLYNTVKNAIADKINRGDTLFGAPVDAPTFSRKNRTILGFSAGQRSALSPYRGQMTVLLGHDFAYASTQIWDGAWRTI